MVSPLCSLWCSCGFHVHRTPHFRSFQYTTIYDVDLRLFELKSWCSRVMLHSLHTFGGSWHENLSAEFEVSFVMLNREDEDGFKRPMGLEYPSCRGWRWNHSDMGRIGPESEMNGWDCLPFERSTSNFAFQVGRWTRWDRMGTNTDKTLYYALSIFW